MAMIGRSAETCTTRGSGAASRWGGAFWGAWACTLTCLALLMGCRADTASGVHDGDASPAPLAQWFELRLGDRSIQAQVAIHSEEQRRGLMFRDSLPPDGGMVFVYLRPQRMSFWMRNTSIPLSIGFFDSQGVLREVHNLYPHDETTVSSHSDQLRLALEMRQGWFREHGVRPGARLHLDDLRRALRARGVDPDRYLAPSNPTP